MRIERTVRVPTLRFSGYLYVNRLDGVEQVLLPSLYRDRRQLKILPEKSGPGIIVSSRQAPTGLGSLENV